MDHEVYLALVEQAEKINFLYETLVEKGVLEKPKETKKNKVG